MDGRKAGVEAVLGMAGRGALLSVKRKVFFLQLFKMDMFTQSIYLKKKKPEFVFPVYNTRYFKAIKIFKVVCLVIWTVPTRLSHFSETVWGMGWGQGLGPEHLCPLLTRV